MANNINALGLNANGIGFAQINQFKKDGEVKKQEEKAPQTNIDKKEVAPKDVLDYMAAQNIDIQPKKANKTLDISKYVTPAQAERIAGFVQGFELDVEKGLANFEAEFPNSGLSDNSKMNVVLDMYNKKQEA